MFTHVQHVGDRLEPLRKQLLDRTGTPVNLNSSTVAFRMVAASDGSVKINDAAAIIEDGANGRVRYEWASGDVDTAADYYAWFIRTEGGKVEHYPTGAELIIHIIPNS
ncbi:MAG: hypothetical protein AB7U73_01245 [Pirellulales bacterium]